jgi:trimeric autotransporter adhesin
VFDPTTEDHRFCMGSTSVTNAYIQVAWTVVSDERDKTELAPVPHGLDFVRALKPTSFRYKADRDSTEGHGPTRYGFLAQEVLALEGDNPVIIDNENPEKLRMTDQSLIAVLVNAIQDQQKIIEGLEQRITALETN